jgi:putative ABC transport system permease protein
MQGLWQDLRYGFRSLLKSRTVTVVAVLALTVGIGATTAIFSVVQAVLLQPLPFRQQDRLAVAWKRDTTANNDFVELSYPEYVDWRTQSHVFEDLAAMPTTVYGYSYVLTGQGDPVQIESARVTANFFSLLGAGAALGHTFTEEEDKQSGNRVVVLNDRFWRERFNADPQIVGKLITLNGAGYQVIGIMPREFDFPKGVDVWTPLATNQPQVNNRANVFMQAIGRLKPGATLEQANTELNTVIRRVAQEHPEMQASGQSAVVAPLYDHIFGSARPALYLLLAASGLLLLIACANITNLLLARATTRRREIALRAALGASRGRIIQQLLTENLLLAVVGSALGLLLSHLLVSLLIRVAPSDIPRLDEIQISVQVLLYTSFVMVLTTILFGLVPAIATSKINLNETLREGGVKMAGYGRGNKLRHAVVIAEVAITLVLLIGAGLVFRTFMNLKQVDLGFDPRNLLTMQVNVHGPRYAKPEQRRDFYSQLVEKLEAQPGVTAAGAILLRPLQGPIGWDISYITEGQSPEDARGNPITNYQVITSRYFRAMGIRLISGREFTEQDREGTPPVVIISETMARRIFPPNTDPAGKRIRLDPSDPQTPWRTVVGVVGDARYRQLGDVRLDVYVPHRQSTDPVRYLTVRTSTDPASFATVVRRELAALDPDLTVTGLMTGEQLVSRAIARPRFNTLLLACLGGVAASLALIGIYGIVAYMVTQRTREIGIRIALGARPRDVLKLILWQSMKLVLLGIAVGCVAAFAATRVVSSLLYGVSATDPLTFIGVSLLLIVVALIACLFPTRRAARVDPMVVLRYE